MWIDYTPPKCKDCRHSNFCALCILSSEETCAELKSLPTELLWESLDKTLEEYLKENAK